MSFDINVGCKKSVLHFAPKKYVFASHGFGDNSDLITSFPQMVQEFRDHWSKKRNSLCIMTPCDMSFWQLTVTEHRYQAVQGQLCFCIAASTFVINNLLVRIISLVLSNSFWRTFQVRDAHVEWNCDFTAYLNGYMGGTMVELYVGTIAKVGNRHICLFLLEPQQDFYLSRIML